MQSFDLLRLEHETGLVILNEFLGVAGTGADIFSPFGVGHANPAFAGQRTDDRFRPATYIIWVATVRYFLGLFRLRFLIRLVGSQDCRCG